MKTKIMRIVLPAVLGIITVLGLLIVFNLIVHNGDAFTKPDNGFFKFFVPITTIIAIIIQATITLPIWESFKHRKKILRLTLTEFTGIICVISGLTFGFVFWERDLGINELILVSLTGLIAFAVYWTINLTTLRQLE